MPLLLPLHLLRPLVLLLLFRYDPRHHNSLHVEDWIQAVSGIIIHSLAMDTPQSMGTQYYLLLPLLLLLFISYNPRRYMSLLVENWGRAVLAILFTFLQCSLISS